MTNEEIILKALADLIKHTTWENKIFLVGGAVRDEIMGLKPKDLDFVVNGDINAGIDFATWLAKQMGIFKQDSNPVIYPRFGTAKLSLVNNNRNLPNIELEFVAPRKETYQTGSRKPDVEGTDLYGEITRRDLTMNSLLKNISTNKILDLSGHGIDDIKNGIIRTTNDPDVIFQEDPLRMMRCIRFFAKYGFKLDEKIIPAIQKNAHLINNISKERINDELNKILVAKNAKSGINLLTKSGILKYIIEELEDTVGMIQNKHHKDDVFGHTLNVLDNTPPNLKTRLMALFHDIGKTVTKSVTPDGDVHFYQHEMIGKDIARKIMTRLKYPNEMIDAVVNGIGEHMSLKQGGNDAKKISDKTLRKFAARVGENLQDVLDLIHADNIAHADDSNMPEQINIVRKRLETLKQQTNIENPKLPINGNDLIALGIKPSPEMKKLLDAVKEAWFENPDITKKQALQIVKDMRLQNTINEIKLMAKKILK